MNKKPPLNLGIQAGVLKSYFPESQITISGSVLTCIYNLVPTPLSATYRVKLVYQWSTSPNVFVIKPKLTLAKGKQKLPHVYNTPMQHLCLYYRKAREWDTHMLLAKTIVPWTSEWLQFYELWLPNGVWQGGGIEHETAAEIQTNNI